MAVSHCVSNLTKIMLHLNVMNNLSVELNNELERRGMSMRALARQANVSVTTISGIISQQIDASADVCVKLAKALGVDAARLLRLAGHLPQVPPDVAEEQDILYAIRQLQPDERRVIKRALLGLVGSRPANPTQRGNTRREEEGKEVLGERANDPYELAVQALDNVATNMPPSVLRLASTWLTRRAEEKERQNLDDTRPAGRVSIREADRVSAGQDGTSTTD